MATPARVVDASTPSAELERWFFDDPLLSCVVVTSGPGEFRVLTRRRYSLSMAGRLGFGRALHSSREVGMLVADADTDVLDGRTPLAEAGRIALSRRVGRRYDDLLVRGGDGTLATVQIADLLNGLATEHEHSAVHDPLTGLANRAGLAAVRDVSGAMLLIDLDDFKAVNDGLGHLAGDELLLHVAKRLRLAVRDQDVVARLGGDEFAVHLPGADAAAASAAADRVLDALSAPVAIGRRAVSVSASVGIGVAEHDGVADLHDLLHRADLAMYEAKAGGKSRKAHYNSTLGRRASSRLELQEDLTRAVKRGQMRLLYQPLVDLADERVVGAEGLLRWEHPVRGTVAPLDFLPLAEQSGAIYEIGAWVLEEGCRQLAEWQARRPVAAQPLRMSLNVSVRQLEWRGFTSDVLQLLAATGVDPTQLTLEVTESALAHETGTVAQVLTRLTDEGLQVAIDDFGTGYSSFARLSDLPIGMLKIDRTFTSRLGEPRSHGVMRGLRGLAEAMGIQPLVEGVETAEQADLLRGLGFRLAQGYLFDRPLEAKVFAERVQAGVGTALTAV